MCVTTRGREADLWPRMDQPANVPSELQMEVIGDVQETGFSTLDNEIAEVAYVDDHFSKLSDRCAKKKKSWKRQRHFQMC